MDATKVSIRKYWDWRSRNFGCDADKSTTIAATWEATLNQLLPATNGKRVLDVGTGLGQFAFYLARSGFAVTGIDISEKMVLNAKRTAESQNLPIHFDTGDAETLKFDDNTYDAVVSRNVLWTLPNPHKALAEWHRVIKPGGTIVVSDGFWMNTTLKRLHQLVYKSLKNLFCKASPISLRFFCTYVRVQKKLPFYEGLRAKDVGPILEGAGFKEIGFYDTAVFTTHPYPNSASHADQPQFFIAHARK